MAYNVLDTVLRIFTKGPSSIHILLSLLNVRKPKYRSVEELEEPAGYHSKNSNTEIQGQLCLTPKLTEQWCLSAKKVKQFSSRLYWSVQQN